MFIRFFVQIKYNIFTRRTTKYGHYEIIYLLVFHFDITHAHVFENLEKLVILRIRQIWVTCTVLFMIDRKTKGHVWTCPSFWPEFRSLLSHSLVLSLLLTLSSFLPCTNPFRVYALARAPGHKHKNIRNVHLTLFVFSLFFRAFRFLPPS